LPKKITFSWKKSTECWNNWTWEKWNSGMMEYWNNGPKFMGWKVSHPALGEKGGSRGENK
jgi:hypothetical protein